MQWVIKPAYNCQAAVSDDGVIVAVYATNKANDKEQLQVIINQAEANTSEKAGLVLADSGLVHTIMIIGCKSRISMHLFLIKKSR